MSRIHSNHDYVYGAALPAALPSLDLLTFSLYQDWSSRESEHHHYPVRRGTTTKSRTNDSSACLPVSGTRVAREKIYATSICNDGLQGRKRSVAQQLVYEGVDGCADFAPQTIGQSSQEVLQSMGYSDAQIHEMRAAGVLRD